MFENGAPRTNGPTREEKSRMEKLHKEKLQDFIPHQFG